MIHLCLMSNTTKTVTCGCEGEGDTDLTWIKPGHCLYLRLPAPACCALAQGAAVPGRA